MVITLFARFTRNNFPEINLNLVVLRHDRLSRGCIYTKSNVKMATLKFTDYSVDFSRKNLIYYCN